MIIFKDNLFETANKLKIEILTFAKRLTQKCITNLCIFEKLSFEMVKKKL